MCLHIGVNGCSIFYWEEIKTQDPWECSGERRGLMGKKGDNDVIIF